MFYIERGNKLLGIFKKIIFSFKQSFFVTQCDITPTKKKELFARLEDFQPDCILMESIYSINLVDKIKEKFNIPYYVRSHNIEHIYIKKQVSASQNLKSYLNFLSISLHLKSLEFKVLKNAEAFLDISQSDLSLWKQQGLENGIWLPPVFPTNHKIENGNNESFEFDIAYIGNLSMPNNVESILWFLKFPLKEVVEQLPNVKVLIAGSNPNKALENYISNLKNVTLMKNPKEIFEIYQKSKIIINPIKLVSGVNIKTIEMLYNAYHVVCTPEAIQGLPSDFKSVFNIADRNKEFSEQIIKILLKNETFDHNLKNKLQKYFSLSYFEEVFEKAISN
ncbi:glycosyltransferase [Belliella sp. DSM 111904]|uniref:Glycosyltransferase n=1 Tax=Belliella filtrata TaxID=2923435 RepID=A0ABS9V4C6_9BACT|nr:glycosyltransferase [Belliella filtrata]MCH7410828.1 glycosyltransferase [Belliella filtrata]